MIFPIKKWPRLVNTVLPKKLKCVLDIQIFVKLHDFFDGLAHKWIFKGTELVWGGSIP